MTMRVQITNLIHQKWKNVQQIRLEYLFTYPKEKERKNKRKKKINPYLTPHLKLDLKLIIDLNLNARAKTIKLLEENLG